MRHLQRHQYHNSILIMLKGGSIPLVTLRPFRFQGAWFTHPEFKNMVVENWNTSIPLNEALHKITGVVKYCNSNVFGNVFI